MLFWRLIKPFDQRDRFAFLTGAEVAFLGVLALAFTLVGAFALDFAGGRGCTRGLEAGLRVLPFFTTLFFATPLEETLRETFFREGCTFLVAFGLRTGLGIALRLDFV